MKMKNFELGKETKLNLKKFLEIYQLTGLTNNIDFSICNTLLVEGMFGEYNQAQQTPNALEYKYKSSRMSLLQAQRAVDKPSDRRYGHDVSCSILTNNTLRNDMESVKNVDEEEDLMRQFCLLKGKGAKTQGVRSFKKAQPGAIYASSSIIQEHPYQLTR